MYDPQVLKRNVNHLMNQKNMKDKHLAEKTGLSLNMIRSVTSGNSNNPTIQNLMAIAETLECSLDKILEYEVPNSLKNEPLNETFIKAALDILHAELVKQEEQVTFSQWCDGLERIYSSIADASQRNHETIVQKQSPDDTRSSAR